MSNDKFITLEQLTRTTKGLVNKVNAESTVFDSKIGDLTNLTTTAKTDLVSAINEAATSGSSGGGVTSYNDLTDKPTIPVVTDTYSSSSTDAMSGVAVNSAITAAIGNINEFEVAVVQTLPSENIDTHTIYFVPKTGSVTDVHDEYMYINNNWELLGSTNIDLSNYLQKTDIADWAKAATKPAYTANEVGAATSDHTHTQISASSTSGNETTTASIKVQNNGIATLTASRSGGSVSTEGTSSIYIYPQSISISATTSVSISDVKTPTNARDAANKQYVDNAVSGITIPTNVSSFTNDAGYLTSYTETDPVFAASAAAGISSTDISNWNAKSDFSGSYNDLTNKPTIPAAQVQSDWNATSGMGVILNKPIIPTVPTNVSSFTNDAGYLTLADLPIYDGTVQNG